MKYKVGDIILENNTALGIIIHTYDMEDYETFGSCYEIKDFHDGRGYLVPIQNFDKNINISKDESKVGKELYG